MDGVSDFNETNTEKGGADEKPVVAAAS